jgi:hypothetical protein
LVVLNVILRFDTSEPVLVKEPKQPPNTADNWIDRIFEEGGSER